MSNVYLERDYSWHATVLIPSTVTWEFELSLDKDTNSSMWYLLVEPWTVREETIFYHRSSGNTVWFYNVNRTWSYEHADNSNVLLVNSIDYMNYILWQTNEQLFLYKTSTTDLVIKGWKFYIASQMVTLSDLDTSEDLTWKTLFNDSTNYIYIDTENLDFLITNSVNNDYFLVATVLTNAWWVIQSITKEKVLHIWTIWETWPQGIQWPPWPKWDQWNPWVDWAEIELQISWWYIQWKYDDAVTWNNLISVASITWADWSDGKEIEISKQNNAISYRYVWDTTWIPVVYLVDIKWNPWSITNWTDPVLVNDIQTPSWTITTNDWTKTITQTNADGTRIEFKEDGIYFYDKDWNLMAKIDKTWTYEAWIIETSTWDIINWVTWTINLNEWTIAFLNKPNIFNDVNTFNQSTIFKANVSYPNHIIDMTWLTTILFDWDNWTKQRTKDMPSSWTITLSFDNIKGWANYALAINVPAWWSISLQKGIISNSWSINDIYTIWSSMAHPLTLTAWTHLFYMDTFVDNADISAKLHISYLWTSSVWWTPL